MSLCIRSQRSIQWLIIALLLPVGMAVAEPDPWSDLGDVLALIAVPEFASRDFPITSFLSNKEQDENGIKARTAIFEAIRACSQAGGGNVIVPPGKWSVDGPIHLSSNVNLHLQQGATLTFGSRVSDYLPVVLTRFEGTELMNYSPLIYAYEKENVGVTGKGTIDGGANEERWWNWKRIETDDVKQLRQLADDNVPVAKRVFGDKGRVRPNFVQFYRCRNVLVEGVTLSNSPMWNIHPVLCNNVTIRGVTVDSHGPNNDGCNPESCQNVLIEDCKFNTGDDCIAIKSGRNADGRRIGVPSENIVIRRCEMQDGHGGVVLGSEMSGGIRNVFVEDCHMDSPNLERAIRLKSNSLRGGFLENMYVRNIVVGEVSDAVLRINLEYSSETGEHFPLVRNILLENVISTKCRRPLYLVGLQERPIENVVLRNCKFDGGKEPSIIEHVNELQLTNYSQSEKKEN